MVANSLEMQYIPCDRIVEGWAHAREYVMAAARRANEMTEDEILYNVLTCRLHLFVLWEEDKVVGAGTVAINQYPDKTAALLVHVGGDLMQFFRFEAAFTEWAKSMGATCIQLKGRRGWRKVLAPDGFKERYVIMEKEL